MGRSLLCNLFKMLEPIPQLNRCKCGSDNIAISIHETLGVRTETVIKCCDCNREVKRRTYKKAEKVWNKNNPMKGGSE